MFRTRILLVAATCALAACAGYQDPCAVPVLMVGIQRHLCPRRHTRFDRLMFTYERAEFTTVA